MTVTLPPGPAAAPAAPAATTTRRRGADGRAYRAAVPPRLADAPLDPHHRHAARGERALARVADTGDAAALLTLVEAAATSLFEGVPCPLADLADAAAHLPTRRRQLPAAAAFAAGAHRSVDAARRGHVDPTRRDGVLALHRLAFRHTPLAAHAGEPRTAQNWIGGPWSTPQTAVFVPPPPDLVDAGVDDVAAVAARRDLPPVARAAIAHAHYETVHPHIDGNGRAGRALIAAVLAADHDAAAAAAPVSTHALADPGAYVDALTAFRRGHHTPIVAWLADALDHAADVAATVHHAAAGAAEPARRRLDAAAPRGRGAAACHAAAARPALLAHTTTGDLADALHTAPATARAALAWLAAADVVDTPDPHATPRTYRSRDVVDRAARVACPVAAAPRR